MFFSILNQLRFPPFNFQSKVSQLSVSNKISNLHQRIRFSVQDSGEKKNDSNGSSGISLSENDVETRHFYPYDE